MLRQFASLTGLTLLTIVLSACGGGSNEGNNPPASSTPPAVTINLTNSAVRVGDTTTLTWSAQGATSCTASGAWSGNENTSGSLSITASAIGSSNYLLSCSGAGGSASENAVLTVAAALQMTNVPGLPAPVPLATGQCVPETTSEYSVTCISSTAAVPSQFAAFSATSATLVTQTGSNTPTVQNATSCTGGFDSNTSEFQVTTSTLGNDAIAFTGATVMEVTYSASYLASLNPGIKSLTALIISDNSNLNHFEVIVSSVTSSGNLALSVGGTVATDTTPTSINVLECINISSIPPPPPPPAGLTCTSENGAATGGLGWAAGPGTNGDFVYSLSTTSATQQSSVILGWGVGYRNPQLSASAYTGSLRVELWALPYSYQSPFQGYRIAIAYPNFTGTGAKSSNQLYNGYSVTGINSAATGQNPPAGSYCMVMVLTEYDSTSCTTADHYCVYDYSQFSPALSFQ